ncbi:DUF742 domain-containing protein [Dactylosporangium sp. CA-092794]|uniref:DUF742 domain-containing protein n=1 Tax=Dactylosporangium sp. CA-092794 TaxID=3239929 RepID=UPI003D918F2C
MAQRGDDPRGALVRPYAVTRGRTEPTRDIAIEAVMLTSERGVGESPYSGRDRHRIAVLCGNRPHSLAEIAAHMRLPLGVARVLVADMVTDGLLELHEPVDATDTDERINVLERVLIGLRAL